MLFTTKPCKVLRLGGPKVGERVAYPLANGEVYGTVRDVGGATIRIAWDLPGYAPAIVLLSDTRLVALGGAA